jgi:hypothetical protein
MRYRHNLATIVGLSSRYVTIAAADTADSAETAPG